MNWDEGEEFTDSNENDIYEEGNLGFQNTTNCTMSISKTILPITYNLFEPSPTPFNPITNIPYGLSKNGDVEIVVYDIQGRQVTTLVDIFNTRGNHSISWNASNYPSGVYLIRIESGDFTQTQKIVLVK